LTFSVGPGPSRSSHTRSSEKFATKGPNITLLEDAQILPALLL